MSRRNAQTLIERSAIKISLLDSDRRFFYFSPALETMLKIGEGSLVGNHILDGVHPGDRDQVDLVFNLQLGMTQSVIFRYACRDGFLRHINATVTNLLDDTEVSGIVMVWEDITAQKRFEENLSDADRRKDEFIAILAHELKNPIAAITNAIYVLKMTGIQDTKSRENFELVEKQTATLNTLANDLLDISAIVKNKITLNKEPILLCAAMQRAAETVKTKIEKHHHKLTIRYPATPILMEADAIRLEQILTNLLANAAKYTEPGGIIDFVAGIEDGNIIISVKDNGIGISPDRLPFIFDLFHQEKGTKRGGLGIGLTLAKQLIELHGGTIQAKSPGEGKGSIFTLKLPTVVGGAYNQSSTPIARRILIVEDNPDGARSLAQLLKLFGHHTECVHNGTDAIRVAREFNPNIVLCDIGLPEMDGYEVARQLRSFFPGLYLIALTGYSTKDDITVATNAGFNYHLSKPVNPPDLQKYIAKIPI